MPQPNLIYYASSTENLDGISLAPSESWRTSQAANTSPKQEMRVVTPVGVLSRWPEEAGHPWD